MIHLIGHYGSQWAPADLLFYMVFFKKHVYKKHKAELGKS